MKQGKTKLILFLIAAIAVCVLISTIIKNCSGGNAVATGKQPDSIIYWRNVAGDLTASLRGAKSDFAIIEKGYKDSIAKLYLSKTKYIKEIVEVTSFLDTELKPTGPTEVDYFPVTKDSCLQCAQSMFQKFENKYYKAEVRVGKNAYMNLTGYDSLVAIWKEFDTLGKKYLQLDITNSNPDVRITGVKSFRQEQKKQKPKRWGIGFQAGYGIDGKIYIGLGVSKNIIRF